MADLKLETLLTLKDRASKQLKGFRKNLKSTKSELKSFAATFTSALAGGLLLKSLFDVNKEFSKLKATVSTFTDSAEETEVAMQFINDIVTKIPENLEDVTTAFIRMKGLGLAPTREALLSFANTAAATGKSIIQFVEAVADATTGEFERLKEFGIKSKREGEIVKFTFQGQTTAIQNTASAVNEYLQAIGNNQFAGAAERQMGTLVGLTSNLRVEWEKLLVKLGEGGANSTFSFILSGLTDVLSGVAQLRGVFIAFFATIDKKAVELTSSFTIFSIKMAKGFSIAITSIKNQFIDLGNSAKRIVNSIGGVFNLDPIFLEKIPKAKADLAGYESAIKAVKDESDAAIAAIDENALALISAGLAANNSSKAIDEYNDKLKEEQKAANSAADAEKKLAKARELADIALAKAQKAADARANRGENIRSNNRTAQEIFNETKQELDSLKSFGDITGETYKRALDKAQTALDDFSDNSKQQFGEVTEFAKEAARGIENGFSTFFFDIMQGNFSDMGDSFKRTIDQMVADFLASQLANALFGGFGTGSNNLGGLVGDGVGFLQGFFADGGSTVANRPMIVGERGPELFTPSVSGNITSNSDLNSGVGNTLNINITAMDSKDVISKLEEVKRPLAEMLNGTNRAYNLTAGVGI